MRRVMAGPFDRDPFLRPFDTIANLPHQIPGNVLSLAPPNATPSNTLWQDKSRGYEVSLTNAVTNGDGTQGLTGWYGFHSANAIVSGKIQNTGSGGGANPAPVIDTGIAGVTGKIMFVVVKFKVLNASCTSVVPRVYTSDLVTNVPIGTVTSPIQNQVYTLSNVIVHPSGYNAKALKVYMHHIYADAATANGKVMEVQEVMCIDLATAFTATREASLADIQLAMTEAGTTFWNGAKTLRFRNNATLSNFAGSATSGWVNEWIECQTGADKEIVNLLGDAGNYALGVGPLGQIGCVRTVVGDEIKIVPTATTGEHYSDTHYPTLQVGHQYYLCSFGRVVAGQARIYLYNRKADGTFEGLPGTLASGSGLISSVLTPTSLYATPAFFARHTITNAAGSQSFTGGAEEIYFKTTHLLDRTAIFGAGNEPIQAEMDKIVQRAITAYGYINTRTLKLAKRWMLRLDGTDDFGAITNSPSLDLGVVAGREQAWAVIFRAGIGSLSGVLLSKNLDSFATMQYGLTYNSAGYAQCYLEGAVRVNTPAASVAQNEFYSVIFCRDKNGVITPILNNISKPTLNYTGTLTTRSNIRIGKRETSATYFKGDMAWQGVWEADTLNIEAIKRSVNKIARNYVAG